MSLSLSMCIHLPCLKNPNNQLNFVSGQSTTRIMHVARTNGIQVTRKQRPIGSWSFYGVLLSEERIPEGKVHSELHILQIRFQIKRLYHHKDLQIEAQGQFILNRKFWELSVLPWTALKKMCWMSQQGTEKSIFRVIFWIGFGIRAAMILQNTITRFNL